MASSPRTLSPTRSFGALKANSDFHSGLNSSRGPSFPLRSPGKTRKKLVRRKENESQKANNFTLYDGVDAKTGNLLEDEGVIKRRLLCALKQCQHQNQESNAANKRSNRKRRLVLDLSTTAERNLALSFRLPRIPSEVFCLTELEELWMTNCGVFAVPSEIGKLQNLVVLGLEGNNIEELPDNVGDLPLLRRLYLGRNRLRTLPQSLSKLSSMQELRVDRNHLAHFPTCILSLHSLRRLSLSHNKIDRLPCGINRLIGLTELSMDNNKIGPEIPEEVACLIHLLELGLSSNEIENFPKVVLRMSSLKILRLSGNRKLGAVEKLVGGDAVSVEEARIKTRHDGFLQLRLPSHTSGTVGLRGSKPVSGLIRESFLFNGLAAKVFDNTNLLCNGDSSRYLCKGDVSEHDSSSGTRTRIMTGSSGGSSSICSSSGSRNTTGDGGGSGAGGRDPARGTNGTHTSANHTDSISLGRQLLRARVRRRKALEAV